MSRRFDLPLVSRLNDLIFLNISHFSTAYYMYRPSHLPSHYSDNFLWPAHYETPHHAIFFALLPVPPSSVQALFSELCYCALSRCLAVSLSRYSNSPHFTLVLNILFPIWNLLGFRHKVRKYNILNRTASNISRTFTFVIPCILILGWRNPTRRNSMQVFIYC